MRDTYGLMLIKQLVSLSDKHRWMLLFRRAHLPAHPAAFLCPVFGTKGTAVLNLVKEIVRRWCYSAGQCGRTWLQGEIKSSRIDKLWIQILQSKIIVIRE